MHEEQQNIHVFIDIFVKSEFFKAGQTKHKTSSRTSKEVGRKTIGELGLSRRGDDIKTECKADMKDETLQFRISGT